jgi:hypothetical protein
MVVKGFESCCAGNQGQNCSKNAKKKVAITKVAYFAEITFFERPSIAGFGTAFSKKTLYLKSDLSKNRLVVLSYNTVFFRIAYAGKQLFTSPLCR